MKGLILIRLNQAELGGAQHPPILAKVYIIDRGIQNGDGNNFVGLEPPPPKFLLPMLMYIVM